MPYDNLQPGVYWGKLVAATLGTFGQNNSEAMVLTFDLTHVANGQNANGETNWEAINPASRDIRFFLTEKAWDNSTRDLMAIGCSDLINPTFKPEIHEGCELLVINEQYQGKTYDKVTIASLSRGASVGELDANKKRALAQKYALAVKAQAKPTTPPPGPKAAPGAPVRTVVKSAGGPPTPTVPASPAPAAPTGGTADDCPF